MLRLYFFRSFEIILFLVASLGIHQTASGAEAHRFNRSIHHREPTEEVAPHFGAGVYSDFLSEYVWRGLSSSRSAVWQPSFSLEYYGVGFNLWANMPIAPQPNQGQFNEIDLTLYYKNNWKMINFHTWVYGVLYPNKDALSRDAGTPSMEWDLHISAPVGPIYLFTDFSLRLVTAAGSVYWDLGVGYQEKLPYNFAIDASVFFALANGKFTEAHVAPVGTVPYQVEFSLAFPWKPVAGLTLTPRMSVSTLLTSGLRAGSSDPTIIWGGLSVGYEFGAAD